MVNYFYLRMTKKPTLIVVAGPTAVGKTSMCIELAKHFNCSIISSDSRQFYRELNIGVAKPNDNELSEVKHHFIGQKSIENLYSAGEFEVDVINFLKHYFKSNDLIIMTGGSGMYIDAVCSGLDEIPRDEKVREELNIQYEKYGLEYIQEKLKQLDPTHYQSVDIKNPQRIIRAIEVCLTTNKPYSSFLNRSSKKRPFKIVKILLHLPKNKLHYNIEKRCEIMIKKGLIEEAESLLSKKHYNALNTVGYKELFDHFETNTNMEETVNKIISNTKKYAKRQMTWFKKDDDYYWINNEDLNVAKSKIISHIQSSMS